MNLQNYEDYVFPQELGPKTWFLGATWVGSPFRKFLGEEGTFHKKKMINDSPNQVAWGTTSLGKMDKIQLHTFVPTIQETPNPFLPGQLNPHLLGEVAPYRKFISPQGIWLRLPFSLRFLGKTSFSPKEILPLIGATT